MSSELDALRLAAWAKQLALGNQIFGGPKDREEMGLIDAELRRLHAENATLSDSCAAKAERIDRLGEMVERLHAENEELRKDVHNLNWALGTEGYSQMATPEEQAEADKASEESAALIERMAEAKARQEALELDAARWREFCTTWPICYLGEDYSDKASLDSAVDAAIEKLKARTG